MANAMHPAPSPQNPWVLSSAMAVLPGVSPLDPSRSKRTDIKREREYEQ